MVVSPESGRIQMEAVVNSSDIFLERLRKTTNIPRIAGLHPTPP
jgi:hypothetical protein